MKTKTRRLGTIVFLTAILLLVSSAAQPTAAQMHPISFALPTSIPDPARVSTALATAPVMFIENIGQFGAGARFQVRGGNGTIYLADDAIWFTVLERPQTSALSRQMLTPERLRAPREDTPRKGANIKLSFVGTNPKVRLEPFNRLDTRVSYFIGNDPKKWRADVPVWGGARYKDLYPGIDLEITSEKGQMVQRVVARAGANLNAVQLRVDGVDKMTLDSDRLRLTTAVGEYTLPLLQAAGAGSAKLPRPTIADKQVTSPFAQSPNRPLTQSPINSSDLLYSTFLGGSDLDYGRCITTDSSGAMYVIGETWSSDFPTTPGTFDPSFNGNSDTFVVKLNAAGSALAYATFLGGSGSDAGYSIAIDSSGATYVTGESGSSDFPTTLGAFDTSYNGSTDAFIVKLNATGSALTYATFLGGSGSDYGRGIAIDSSGAVYVTGMTYSSDFPTTLGAFDPSFNGSTDAFLVKLNADGSALTYATFLGGSNHDQPWDIAVDLSGAVYATGRTWSSDFPITPGAFDSSLNGSNDAFVVKLNAAGSALTYATFLGGNGSDGSYSIAIDSVNAAYITGWTSSSDFPTTPGAFDPSFNGSTDAFVVKLNAAGSALAYATFLGGTNFDWGWGIAIDSSNTAYITGWTNSSDFPTTPGAFDPSFNGNDDVFVVKLNATGSVLLYATFLGGGSNEGETSIAVDLSGVAYVTGTTNSSDFPTTSGAFDPSFNGSADIFVVKLWMGSNQSSSYIYLPFIKK